MTDIIEVKNLGVATDKQQILSNVSLSIPENTITTIVGPSGSGKSTLIRTFNRLTDLYPRLRVNGEVLFHGRSVREYKVMLLRRRIGLVFQKPNPFPMSVFDNVAFGPKLHASLTGSQLDTIVEESLKHAGLYGEVKDNMEKNAMDLSGGQQQRLCIARALAVQPEVLMMDEPTSSLDPIAKSRIEELMLRLKEDYTVVLVTHDIDQANRVSDSIELLYNGKIVEYEKPDVLQMPEYEHARQFVMKLSRQVGRQSRSTSENGCFVKLMRGSLV